MKRFLLYAMMTAGVLASCSQGENDGLPQDDSVNGGTDAAPILLSAVAPSASVEASTRSAGTVGGKGDANVWSGQRLHIFAFQKDATTGETYGDKITGDKTFFDKIGIAASDNETVVKWENDQTLYFPRSGAYDFFGYYADDALGANPTYETGTNTLYANFTIDGSQDLMIAKAKLSTEQEAALGDDKYKAYSAYTARKGYQPAMTFEHLLTRLTFNIQGMGDQGPENVYVKSIRVKSRNTGKLVFAYVTDTDKGAVFDQFTPETLPFLYLKERNMQGVMQALDADITFTEADLTEDIKDFKGTIGKYHASATGAANATPVGEALLVEPGVTSYALEVDVVQYYNKNGKIITDLTQRENTYKLNLDIAKVAPPKGEPTPTIFEASKSYDVTIQVHGLTEITLTAKLGEWKDGGSIVFDPDNDFSNDVK
ncbi:MULTISPECIES: fimbrillin family protein [Bacteroides]|jgi:hypothetical protein|uniref:Fimbrillin family protein n=2 Tax=Bacteroides finegoldii TaxID=338188 RepID=A0A7J4YQ26_9BACE|nr:MULTISPECIES: fimbrillin family protein [Bacteroides]EEX44185.1 hypothetical protein BACFIN_08177 [Bacteroides finegoldii DSM 17565]KAA5227347.1 fimbrillin family protein [Bacteroides finegoldii]KAA5230686.1 fimbrillin family protein [Bacteroides finegoldii]KAA5255617.1 fimbrillin family protein [Bacteroides finegoldii]KAA5258017.1 fimbrillin family protein [Bacteroides finegoldii]